MVRQVHKHVANMMNEAKKLSRPPVSEPKNRSLPHMPVYLPNISRSTTSSNINNICLEYVIRERQLNQSLEKMMCPMSTITAQRKVRTTLPGINDRNDKI